MLDACLQRTRHSENGIWLCGNANTNGGCIWLVVDLGLPIVDLVLLGYGQIGLHTALGIKELDFSTAFDEAVRNLKSRFEFPGAYTLLLNCQELAEGYVCGGGLGWVTFDEG